MTDSVHDQPDFVPVYDEDETIEIRRGDLRALLDLATGSMDFCSGFWDEEQVEIARKIAKILGVDPVLVTPDNFTYQYVCQARGEHKWRRLDPPWTRPRVPPLPGEILATWVCDVCRHTTVNDEPSTNMTEKRRKIF